MSSRSVASMAGVYSAAAGWKIGYRYKSTPEMFNCRGRPWTLVMPVWSPESSFVEKFPNVQITFGLMSSIWRQRYGWHASISSGRGSRLLGGRDLRTLAM